jgi:glycosyltransferase involved in cell wall biosynthesis
MKNFKIAWVLPVAWYYWQPSLSEFTKDFPNTKIFTGLFPGFAKGFEDSLSVEVVGQFKVIPITKETSNYGSNITYLSPRIINSLLQFKPNVIFSSSFGIWTIISLLLKIWCRWKVVIAYEGSSPSVDYCHSKIRIFLRQIMVKMADAYITNSQKGKEYLINTLKADPNLVFAQPYEVPSAKTLFSNTEKNFASLSDFKKPIFLSVGHIIPRKGIDILLKACNILQKQDNRQYTLLIVGDGEQRKELEDYCLNNNLENNVKWVGRVEYHRINVYFKNMDIFIFPTWEETWGVVLLEAMLFGKPAICSTGAGSSEMIVDEENGYLFNPNDPEKLAKLMSNFIDNYDLVNLMGKKSQQKINNYTPEKAGKFLADVVETIFKTNQ